MVNAALHEAWKEQEAAGLLEPERLPIGPDFVTYYYETPEEDPVPEYEFSSLDRHTDNRPATYGDPFAVLYRKERETQRTCATGKRFGYAKDSVSFAIEDRFTMAR